MAKVLEAIKVLPPKTPTVTQLNIRCGRFTLGLTMPAHRTGASLKGGPRRGRRERG